MTINIDTILQSLYLATESDFFQFFVTDEKNVEGLLAAINMAPAGMIQFVQTQDSLTRISFTLLLMSSAPREVYDPLSSPNTFSIQILTSRVKKSHKVACVDFPTKKFHVHSLLRYYYESWNIIITQVDKKDRYCLTIPSNDRMCFNASKLLLTFQVTTT